MTAKQAGIMEKKNARTRPAVVCALIALVTTAVYAASNATVNLPSQNPATPSASSPSPELFVPLSSAGVSNLIYSADGSLLAGSSDIDKTIKVFDTRSNLELRTFSGHEGPITGVAVLPDNETVVSSSI